MADNYFLYARKSTDSEERQILSIEAQLAELRIFAEREKIIIVRQFTESMTAKTPGRPIFNDMISRIEKGEAQGILAWHPDRLARNSVDGGRVIYLLDTGHIKFLKFPTFWFENTPQGKFMMSIAFGQSKYYVDNLSENIRRGQRHKIRRGEFPGLAPIGYLNDPISRKIVIDPSRAPLIQKLFVELVRSAVPHKHKKHLFHFLGLAVCSTCGCSITAERQKGHHYYRCTKKKDKCPEPYVREEALAEQISRAVSKVALPDEVFQKMMAAWAEEQETVSQPLAQFKIELAAKVPEIQSKLDRLLDAHLEGLVEKSEYQAKKESLLKTKIDLEEHLKKLEQETTGWLEPCREFLEAAHQVAIEGNLESLRETAKKIGSNFRLYLSPWIL